MSSFETEYEKMMTFLTVPHPLHHMKLYERELVRVAPLDALALSPVTLQP